MSKCGYKCGEDIACFDEHWGFCPFCGKPWPEQKPPLSQRKETEAEIVLRAICNEFELPPARRAALVLRTLGFTWEDLHRLYSEGQLSDLEYHKYNNTLNALQDIEERNDT